MESTVHGTLEISRVERCGVVANIPTGRGLSFLLLASESCVKLWQSRKVRGSRVCKSGILVRWRT